MMFAKIVMKGCLVLFLVSVAYAGEGKVTYLPIKPVPNIEKNEHSVQVEHNIRLIRAVGVVNRITDEEILISDAPYRFAKDIVFFSKDQKKLEKTDITKGCIVGLRLDDNGEIYKLWKLEEPRQ